MKQQSKQMSSLSNTAETVQMQLVTELQSQQVKAGRQYSVDAAM